MFCKKCGSQIPDGSTFCSECGAATDAVPVESTANERSINAFVAKLAANKKRLTGIIAVGAAALVIAIVLIAVLAGGNGWEKVLKKEMKSMKTGDGEPIAELISDEMYEAIADYYEVDAEELKDCCGDVFSDEYFMDDDYTFVKYEVVREKDLNSGELKEIKEYMKERGISSKDDIKGAVKVKVRVYFKDEDGDRDDGTTEFYFVKIDGKWYDYKIIREVCRAAGCLYGG